MSEQMGQSSERHHYIPCFYTKRWVGPVGMLCEFSRPYKSVIARRKYPKQVGFEPGLYTLPGLTAGAQQDLEDKFFKNTDQLASDAIDCMLKHKTTRILPVLRSAFARLLTSLMFRTPSGISQIRAALQQDLEPLFLEMQQRGEVEQEKFWRADLENRRWGHGLAYLSDNPLIGGHIVNMIWDILMLPRSNVNLLTADRPLITTRGFAHKEGHIAIPLAPRLLFLATNHPGTRSEIMRMSDSQITYKINDLLVGQADRYVYGCDETHLAFVERRLGKSKRFPDL